MASERATPAIAIDLHVTRRSDHVPSAVLVDLDANVVGPSWQLYLLALAVPDPRGCVRLAELRSKNSNWTWASTLAKYQIKMTTLLDPDCHVCKLLPDNYWNELRASMERSGASKEDVELALSSPSVPTLSTRGRNPSAARSVVQNQNFAAEVAAQRLPRGQATRRDEASPASRRPSGSGRRCRRCSAFAFAASNVTALARGVEASPWLPSFEREMGYCDRSSCFMPCAKRGIDPVANGIVAWTATARTLCWRSSHSV